VIGYLKTGGVVAGLALATWLGLQLREKARLEGVERDFKACEASVTAGGEPALVCPQQLSDAVTRARRYLLCDAGLKAGDAYRVRAACSEAVKRRDAQATAAQASADSLTAALADLKAGQAAAIARATARAATSARKEADARSALARAPKVGGPAGPDRVRCDDACLRDLTGQ
jgi:hypothetical protein